MSGYLILTMAIAFMCANLCGAWMTLARLRAKQVQRPSAQSAEASRQATANVVINLGLVRLETAGFRFSLFAVPTIIAIAFIVLGVAVHRFW